MGHRRSGEVEGVRQSRGNWEIANQTHGFRKKKYIIPPLGNGTLEVSENKRMGTIQAEESWYQEHLSKPLPSNATSIGVPAAVGSPVESPEGRSRRIRRLAAVSCCLTDR